MRWVLEGMITLEMILERLRSLPLPIDEGERLGSFQVGGPSTLPVGFDVLREA